MIDTPPEPLPAQEQVIEQKLLACGLKAGGFAVRYEDKLQSIEVVIMPAAETAPEHFPCIREAVFPEIVTFQDGAMFSQYTDFQEELARPQALADAEAELRKRGLLERFPNRNNFATLAEYARAPETHAGWEPGSAIKAEGGNTLTFDPPRQSSFSGETVESYSVILLVMIYASVGAGVKIGFIGNEVVAE
jgi:hypothetical protein